MTQRASNRLKRVLNKNVYNCKGQVNVYHVLPRDRQEVLLIRDRNLIRRYNDVKRRLPCIQVLRSPTSSQNFPLLLIPPVRQYLQWVHQIEMRI